MADKFLGTLRVDLAAFTAGFDKNLDKSLNKFDRFGRTMERKFTKFGKRLTASVTLPLIAAATASVVAADKIAKSQRTIQIATGATGDVLVQLNEDFLQIAGNIPEAFDAIAMSMGSLQTQTGETGEPLRNLVETILAGSRLMGEDGASNAQLMGRMIKQLGLDAKQGSEFYARLFENSQKFDVSIGRQLENLRTFGPVMSNANISIETQADLFARLESKGIDVARVMPGINQAIRKFAEAGLDGKDALFAVVEGIASASDEMEALTIASDLFGSEGATRLTAAIRDGVFNIEELGKAAGLTAEQVRDLEESNRTLGERAKLLGNRLSISLKPVGDELIGILENIEPFATRLIGKLEQATKWFGNLDPKMQSIILGAAGLLAVVGPLVAGLGFMVGNIVALSTFSARSIVWISKMSLSMGSFAVSTDLAALSLTSLLKVFASVVATAAAGFSIGTLLATEVRGVEEFSAKMIAAVQVGWVEIKKIWETGIGGLKVLTVEFGNWLIGQVVDLIPDVTGLLSAAVQGINPALSGALLAIGPGIEASARSILATAGFSPDQIRSDMSNTINALDEEIVKFGNILDTSLDQIADKYSNPERAFGDGFIEQMRGYTEPIIAAFDEIKDSIAGGGGGLTDKLLEVKDIINQTLGEIPDGQLEGMTEDIENLALSLDDVVKALTKVDKKKKETEDGFVDAFKGRMLDAVEGWSSTVSKTMTDFLFNADATFDGVLQSFVEMLTQMLIQELIFAPIFAAIKTAFGIGAASGGGGTREAHGGAYDGGERLRFASGGVVTRPTRFRSTRSANNLMGEAGPEAIMPLSRTAGGDLGVKVAGGGAGGMVVNVIDQRSGGEDVGVSESRGANGERQIEILIRDKMKGMLNSGVFDRTFDSNFGMRRSAVSR